MSGLDIPRRAHQAIARMQETQGARRLSAGGSSSQKRPPKGRLARTRRHTRALIGWREWVALPDLGVPAIKVKIDTGARTSALHAENIEIFERGGLRFARFWVFPVQRSRRNAILCEAPVVDRRTVTDSGGHREERWIIRTRIRVAEEEWETEVSLTNRDAMTFRMLLGRATLGRRFVVHPAASFLVGEPKPTLTRTRRLRASGERK